MQNSYLFYDIETSGLNKCFDQVLQFAAIRTDLDLNELERHEIFIRLNPDLIPAPTAVLVHQLTLEQIQRGVCEYEAMGEIHRLFNTPGTITVGYNNLGFDDEFLRFSFYRNLLTPYTHQYANNCGRMDLYPLTVLYYLFKPKVAIWPKINEVVTLKLEHLSLQNKLMHGHAHNALHDVEATIALARLLKKEQKIWEYLTGCFNKKIDLARLEKLSLVNHQYRQALLIDGSLGAAKFYQVPALGLGLHHHYKNQSLWFPLDSFLLSAVTLANIATTTFVQRKRFGEPPILLPLTSRFTLFLAEKSVELVTTNLTWIAKNPKLFSEVINYHQEYRYPEVPNLDLDAALYRVGFMNDHDRLKCARFHAVGIREKLDLIDSFFDRNLRSQAIRLLGRNYPEILAIKQEPYQEFLDYLGKIKAGELIVNYKNEPRLTATAALFEIANLQQTKNLNVLQLQLLSELAKYIQSW